MNIASHRQLPTNLVTAGVSGLIATVPFTGVMKSLHKYLVLHNPWSPPPKKITVRIARRLGISVPT
ncbi:MAG TPA: hypothetical protein VLH08_21965, partial [Acidobacteriota bacterium]|nr:hypothetical protein [Acidobacteriota bacterium]